MTFSGWKKPGTVYFDLAVIHRTRGEDRRLMEKLRMVKGKFHGAAPAHGQSGDVVVLRLVGGRIPSVYDRHQFLQDEIVHVIADRIIFPVRIVAVLGGRHDDDDVPLTGIVLDAGPSLPVGGGTGSCWSAWSGSAGIF